MDELTYVRGVTRACVSDSGLPSVEISVVVNGRILVWHKTGEVVDGGSTVRLARGAGEGVRSDVSSAGASQNACRLDRFVEQCDSQGGCGDEGGK